MTSAIFYLVISVSLFVILLLLKVYCKLTAGRCHSQQDMTGKTVLITGASAGIGKETALDLARRNARVILACRNLKKAEKVKLEIVSVTGNTNLEVKHLDLESFDSVRKCAKDVLANENRLDVLINNAGTLVEGVQMTKDGYEKTFQTNHLSPFLLTLLLLDLLKKSSPSRIINVSSLAYRFAFLNVDDINGMQQNFILIYFSNNYHRSKLANILFTTELARRLDSTGVTVNALHPGVVKTDIFSKYKSPVLWLDRFLLCFVGKSAEEGAHTSIYLAVAPEVEKITGKYFCDCRERELRGQGRDRKTARRLFEISEKVVGEKLQC